jgi:hypothetical protein
MPTPPQPAKKPSIDEALYGTIPADFSEADRFRVKFIREHLDLPYEACHFLSKEPLNSIINWVNENPGFPKSDKFGFFHWPLEKHEESDPRETIPRCCPAQRIVPLHRTFRHKSQEMIWVPYLSTYQDIETIRDIYLTRQRESSDGSFISPYMAAVSSMTRLCSVNQKEMEKMVSYFIFA